jgi:hypothetical protein
VYRPVITLSDVRRTAEEARLKKQALEGIATLPEGVGRFFAGAEAEKAAAERAWQKMDEFARGVLADRRLQEAVGPAAVESARAQLEELVEQERQKALAEVPRPEQVRVRPGLEAFKAAAKELWGKASRQYWLNTKAGLKDFANALLHGLNIRVSKRAGKGELRRAPPFLAPPAPPNFPIVLAAHSPAEGREDVVESVLEEYRGELRSTVAQIAIKHKTDFTCDIAGSFNPKISNDIENISYSSSPAETLRHLNNLAADLNKYGEELGKLSEQLRNAYEFVKRVYNVDEAAVQREIEKLRMQSVVGYEMYPFKPLSENNRLAYEYQVELGILRSHLDKTLECLDKVDHKASPEFAAACFSYAAEALDRHGKELQMYSEELFGMYDQLKMRHGVSDDEVVKAKERSQRLSKEMRAIKEQKRKSMYKEKKRKGYTPMWKLFAEAERELRGVKEVYGEGAEQEKKK